MASTASEAVERIGRVVRGRRVEKEQANRPLGLFLLVGPAEDDAPFIARTIAESEFAGPEAVLRFDMAGYRERHLIGDLVGHPPGMVVGYGPPGLLAEPVRLNPDRVILLEQVEEAHPDAHNMLLQIAEEGSLCDSRGRHVDFRGTVVILTTAAGVLPQRVVLPELFGLLDDVIDFGNTVDGAQGSPADESVQRKSGGT